MRVQRKYWPYEYEDDQATADAKDAAELLAGEATLDGETCATCGAWLQVMFRSATRIYVLPVGTQRGNRSEAEDSVVRGAHCPKCRVDETMDTTIKHADVKVKLTGFDGNAFSILGRVAKALKRAGYGDEVDTFYAEATAGDYNHLLQTAMRWVEVQ